MGNCQAICAAGLVVQHANGKIERFYWPIPASEVMKMNPGHYVSSIIPLPVSEQVEHGDEKTVHYTRVKLLRPDEILVLGHAYRLITSQEVMKVARAKKHGKMKKPQLESIQKELITQQKQSRSVEKKGGEAEKKIKANIQHVRYRPRSSKAMAIRSKTWRPALQSISEAGKVDADSTVQCN